MDLNIPRRSRYTALIIGSLLLSFEMDLRLGALPLGFLIHLAGGAAALWGCSGLLPSRGEEGFWIKKIILLLVLSGLVFTLLQELCAFLSLDKPDLPWPIPLTQVLEMAATVVYTCALVLFTLGMKKAARNRGHLAAGQAWHSVYLVSLVSYTAAGAVWTVSHFLSRWQASGDLALGKTLHEILCLLFTFLLVFATALPLICILKALAAAAALDTAILGNKRSLPCRFMLHPAGLVTLLTLLFYPFWFSLFVFVHVNTTPDFDSFVRTYPGAFEFSVLPEAPKILSSVEEGAFSLGDPMPPPGASPQGECGLTRYQAGIHIRHGEEALLDLKYQVAFLLDPEKGGVSGLRAEPIIELHDPRFRLYCRAYIPAEPRVEKNAGHDGSLSNLNITFPFHLDVILVSGGGPSVFKVHRAEGLSVEEPRRYPEMELLLKPDGISQASGTTRLSLLGLLPGLAQLVGLTETPPYEQGIQHALIVDGELLLGCAGDSGTTHSNRVWVWTGINSTEYSYELIYEHQVFTDRGGYTHLSSRKAKQSLNKDWFNQIW